MEVDETVGVPKDPLAPTEVSEANMAKRIRDAVKNLATTNVEGQSYTIIPSGTFAYMD